MNSIHISREWCGSFKNKTSRMMARVMAIIVMSMGMMFMPLSSASAMALTSQNLSDIESGMDAIYSQAIFGSNPIDIRFGNLQTVAAPSFLNIDETNFGNLRNLRNPQFGDPDFDRLTISMFFVDEIIFGNAGVVGLAATGGNFMAVETRNSFGKSFSDKLNAHELGHNLSLGHIFDDGSNLMSPNVGGVANIVQSQLDIILASQFVQTDLNNSLFINIDPYLIVEAIVSPVPLPAAFPLFASGLAFLGFVGWRRKKVAQA